MLFLLFGSAIVVDPLIPLNIIFFDFWKAVSFLEFGLTFITFPKHASFVTLAANYSGNKFAENRWYMFFHSQRDTLQKKSDILVVFTNAHVVREILCEADMFWPE